jgi:hypothetical protein
MTWFPDPGPSPTDLANAGSRAAAQGLGYSSVWAKRAGSQSMSIAIELTNPLSAKLLADRLATLSELR